MGRSWNGPNSRCALLTRQPGSSAGTPDSASERRGGMKAMGLEARIPKACLIRKRFGPDGEVGRERRGHGDLKKLLARAHDSFSRIVRFGVVTTLTMDATIEMKRVACAGSWTPAVPAVEKYRARCRFTEFVRVPFVPCRSPRPAGRRRTRSPVRSQRNRASRRR